MERAVARTFQDLGVWKKAHEFVLAIYRFTAFFPHHEVYGLTIRMRRVRYLFRPILLKDLRSEANPIKSDS